MSTTPILGLTEMAAAQTQPEVIVNDNVRALEVFAQIVAIAMDENTPPGSPADGDTYVLGSAPTGDWASHAFEIAYYSGGWQFLSPLEGWAVWSIADAGTYRYTTGSPPWVLDVMPAGAVDAQNVTYSPTNPETSPLTNNVEEALDDLFNSVAALGTPSAGDVVYVPKTGLASPASDTVEEALDDLFEYVDDLQDRDTSLSAMGIAFSVAGLPDDAGEYNIMVPFAMSIAAALVGSGGYAGVVATGSSAFSLAKNGAAAFGTVTYGIGASAPVFASASGATFVAGDRLTITCPTPQDATLADVGFTIRATRS